jgi:acyl-ACP thioesterase
MSKYEFHSHVRYSECGEDGRLSLKSVVDYFQDTATFQGEHLGIGVGYLKKQNIAWILTSWQIITDHFPKLAEPVTAQTWAYDFKNFYGLRNLVLLDGEGRKAAWANSVWVLMDMKRMRPVKVPPLLLEKYGSDEPLEMEYAPRKIKEPETGEEMTPFAVVKTHLDTNHHVNNGQYIEMARTYLPEKFDLYETRVEYKAQAHLGDLICPKVCTEDGVVTVSLRNEEGRSYCVVRFAERGRE